MSAWRRWFIRLASTALIVTATGAGTTGCLYQRHVVDEPGEHVSPEAIQAIIAQESPVLFSDGVTPIGVFFAEEHRIYVPEEDIPEDWVNAIVAAEDQRFFSHPGFDWRGITRAMIQNIKAGRVVAGGSTLTQQTAKNLYYRPDRSLRSKWEELVNALRLEAHYDKRKILEFYANQFHVSANGRGLAIAARYFFDKEVDALTTLECAFIAGLVKAPAAYNPFVGSTEEKRAAARARAKARTGYVLDRMLDMGTLDTATHAQLKAQEIPFKRGTFRYDSSVLIDEVAARLEQPPFPDVFAALAIDNPSTAGVQVVTTLHAEVQRDATYSMWHHLSQAGAWLEGPEASALRLPEDTPLAASSADPLEPHTFHVARVTAASTEQRTLTVDIGGRSCTVDKDGIDRMATILAGARTARKRRSADARDRAALFAALSVGARTWVSVRTATTCDLEWRPKLQGGLMVLEDGLVRAMVGGNDNRNFNRATTARRQLGSTWKVLVYATAMHLGWLPTDVLDNRTGAFYFEGTWYYPRPDHNPQPFVSLDQAGTMSENLASIWLLHHLVDHLDGAQFEAVARQAGLAPSSVGDDREAWVARVRDEYGVIATEGRFDEVAFTGAKLDVLSELPWTDPTRLEVQALLHGRGTQSEEGKLSGRDSRADQKRAALRFNARRFAELTPKCIEQARALTRYAADAAVGRPVGALPGLGISGAMLPSSTPLPDAAEFSALWVPADSDTLTLACGAPDDSWVPVDATLLRRLASPSAPRVPRADAILLDGRLPLSVFARIQRAREKRALVLQGQDPYDFAVLQYHPDFRTLVGLRHLAARAASYGVTSDLPPVMSLPLGAAEISLEEAALVFQGIATGQSWQFPGRVVAPGVAEQTTAASDTPTLLIAEIRDREGTVLWRAEPEPVPVGDPIVGRMTGEVLRNVVRWGTGRRARGAARVGGSPVPLTGKTGTTNSFKNAAFCGLVPSLDADGWTWSDAFTITSYVGYDDNSPMSRGGVRLAGSSGALPAWMGTAAALADAGLLGDGKATSSELRVEGGYVRVPLTADGTGMPVVGAESGADIPDDQRYTVVRSGGALPDGTLHVERRLTPIAMPGEAPTTVEAPSPGQASSLEDNVDDAILGNPVPTDDDIDPFIAPEDD